MLIGHTRRDREGFDAGTEGGGVAADKGWSQAQLLAAPGQNLAVERQGARPVALLVTRAVR